MRGIAATAVALAHFGVLPASGLDFMWHNAVDLFFCLSGFTLSYVYSRETFNFLDYLIARIARIYPLYLVCLVVTGVLFIGPYMVNPTTYPIGQALIDFVLQFAMVNAWPLIGTGLHWDAPAWSLSAEWFCYLLVFPLLLFQNPPPSAATRLLGIVLASAASYWLFVHYFDTNVNAVEMYVPRSPLSYWVPLARAVLGFTAGWFAFSSFRERDGLYDVCTRSAGLIWCAIGSIVLLSYCGVTNPQSQVFVYPFAILAATGSNSTASRILASGPLHFLGVISYSIYMTHFIVLYGFMTALGRPAEWSPHIFAAAIGVTVIVSVCSYFALEMPARDLIRNLRRWRAIVARN